jgi:hypothetical protein
MLKKFTPFFFTFLLISTLPVIGKCQSKENIKTVLGNQWISKYKVLKVDLENKAASVKDRNDISETDLASIQKSYNLTSGMLQVWLDDLVVILEKSEPAKMEYFTKGELCPELEIRLREIITYYSNEFNTKFEEITGQESHFVIGMPEKKETNSSIPPSNITWKFEVEDITASIKKPLAPANWNSLN